MRICHVNLILLLLSALVLTSCATLPSSRQDAPQNQPIAWENRVGVLSTIQTWDLKGLIAIRAERDAFSANWQWQQQTNHSYKIALLGPLGSNSLQLTGETNHVLLETSDGKKLTANNPESLLEKQLGWRLPVSHLYYWIRGLPVPTLPAQKQFDAYNHLITLTQQDWTVQYLRYISINHIDLPNKIVMANPNINVKIIITQWQF